MKRTIIKIDEALCNGCGACVSGCHEGALQLIDGKAVMVSELYCDGLGACIGECPVGAITLEEREAEPYDERAVMERIAPKGEAVIAAHLNHLKDHGEAELLRQGMEWLEEHGIAVNMAAGVAPQPAACSTATGERPQGQGGQPNENEKPLPCGCPGSMMRDLRSEAAPAAGRGYAVAGGFPGGAAGGFTPVAPQPSELRQFPVQLHLLNPAAPFFAGADLLLAADCTAFAAGDFHSRFLKGRMLAIACPKLDSNIQSYIDKLAGMIDQARINTLTVVIMEVPCCGGLVRIAEAAREKAQRNVPLKVIVLSVRGEVISEDWI